MFANSNLKNVSSGMMRVVDSIADLSKDEKVAAISAVFNCLYRNKLTESYTLPDIMGIVDEMRHESKRMKVPEFGGAERYIKGEI
tara:strand:+ start:1110 stop:1364 length:255 start_codon:yes stop_codon:yes gene_type:complete